MTKRYECEIKTRKGAVSFWAKAGGYLLVDLNGHGSAQACERGHVNAGRAISVGGEYTTLSDDGFRAICTRWMRARARKMSAERAQVAAYRLARLADNRSA